LGLFQNNYNRPGPGVNKDAPKKKAFFQFFELLFRKFWDLVKLNLLFSVPVIIMVVLICFLNVITKLTFILVFPLVLIFPFVAGLTLVTRNYAREEHAFILSDFFSAVKSNWVTFLINGIVCYAVYLIFYVSISFYSAQIKSNNLFFFPLIICIIISVLFLFAQYYVPVMMITFDLKLSQIYKNAMIFSIIGLWRNLLLTAILGVIVLAFTIMVQLMPLTFLIAVILIIFNLFAFCMFLINFVVYPLVDKTMIQPYLEKDEESDADTIK
jgi:uncharacterized membrane protein YesL